MCVSVCERNEAKTFHQNFLNVERPFSEVKETANGIMQCSTLYKCYLQGEHTVMLTTNVHYGVTQSLWLLLDDVL